MTTKSTQWTKTNLFNGKQVVWSANEGNICVVRDNREGRSDANYPYRLEVDSKYEGDYRSLANAKKDGLIIYNDAHKERG